MKRAIMPYGGYFERFMMTNAHKLRNYSEVLAAEYGAHGTEKRKKFDEEAYAFYSGLIILEARKKAKMTQAELAELIGADKSYISRIEKDYRYLPSSSSMPR